MHSTTITLLKAIINGTSDTQALREIVGIKEWQYNEQVKKLLQDGIIVKDGNIIKLQENAKTILLRDISKKWDLEKLLRGSNELVVSHLTEPLTVSNIVKNTGLSTTTVYRAISDLETIGAIKKEFNANDYQGSKLPERASIDDSKEPLINLARILKTEREKMYEPDADIIYKDENRILKKVAKRKVTEGELTAFSLFTDYGIKYESPFDYYIKQEKPLDIHDVIIHSILAAQKDNDKMGLVMAIVFYVENKNKTDTLTLRKVSSSFGVNEIWIDVEAYLRRKELKNKDLFLPWEEFVSKARLYEINSEKYSLPDSTPTLFQDISNHISKPMKIYLFGGENMRIKNLKASTKDCDVIVENSVDFDSLVDVLTKLGYKPVIETEFSEEDIRLYPDQILVHPNRSRLDLFTKKILKDLSLTDRMINEADFLDYGNLKVGLLRNEDVFLLKAVACREGDIQDMATLAQGGSNQPQQYQHGPFDWETIWNEILNQEKINPLRSFTPDISSQISFLAEQTGIKAPITDKLRRHVIDLLLRSILRGEKKPLKKIVSWLVGGDISEQMVRNRIDALVREEIIEKHTIGKETYVDLQSIQAFPYPEWEVNPKNLEMYFGWRFPLRDASTDQFIEKFSEEIIFLGYNSIGPIDDIIVNHLDLFFRYEKECFQELLKHVGAARSCIGLSTPKLGNNGKSNFYIRDFQKYGKVEEVQLVNKTHDRRQTI